MNSADLATHIKQAVLDCGYDLCGIIKVSEMAEYAAAIFNRIAHFPESEPMYGGLRAFASPTKMLPWAKSVIICAQWYGKYHIPENLHGMIGKYYCVDVRKDPNSKENQGIHQLEQILTDLGITHAAKHDFGITAMRWAAAKAGIGIIRKNNFFYGECGSWYLLDSFLIDHELELKASPSIKSCPEKCGLCIKACPTGALSEPFQMNGPACVSFLNTMGTCAPGKKHYDRCGSWVFGCDACQDACPFNRKAWDARENFPGLEELAGQISYEQLLVMDYAALNALLPQKFWYIRPDSLWKWKCNVLNAIHNNYDAKYFPYIEHATKDQKEEVREMAKWVLRSLA